MVSLSIFLYLCSRSYKCIFSNLIKAGNCSYLVRPSEQSSGDFTLFFNADNTIHRFRIMRQRYKKDDDQDKNKKMSTEQSSDILIDDSHEDDNGHIYFQIGGRYFKRY